MKEKTFTLKTARLELSIISASHLNDVFSTLNHRIVAETISFLTWPMTMDQAQEWCSKATQGFNTKREFLFIANHIESHEPVGCICVLLDADSSRGEIGYWVSEPWHGKGIASEMAGAIVGFSFRTLGLRVLTAKIAPNNRASVGAVRKLGFKPSGKEMKRTAKGTDLELIVYELKDVH